MARLRWKHRIGLMPRTSRLFPIHSLGRERHIIIPAFTDSPRDEGQNRHHNFRFHNNAFVILSLGLHPAESSYVPGVSPTFLFRQCLSLGDVRGSWRVRVIDIGIPHTIFPLSVRRCRNNFGIDTAYVPVRSQGLWLQRRHGTHTFGADEHAADQREFHFGSSDSGLDVLVVMDLHER